MFIPYGTDRPQRRFPWMNIAVIAANVVVYLLSHSFAHDPQNPNAGTGLALAWYPYMLNPGPQFGGLKLSQFITYQFLHADLSHIGFNMLFLYVFGNNLNEKLGHTGYLLFYLAGGVFAGCGQVLSMPLTPTLGASGSISAVAGLFLMLLPRIHIKLFIWFFYVDVWEIPSVYFILFKIGQDVFEQFSGGSNVAYMAHLTGTAAGVLVGGILLLTHLVQRDHYDMLAMLNRFRRRQEYKTVVSRGYDPFAHASPVPAAPRGTINAAGNADPRIDSLRAEISRLLRVHDSAGATQRYLELIAIDATQVLASQEQVDVGSQLMADQKYAAAAKAFEGYLRVYPTGGAGQQEQITLMLGLIYVRYERNPARARELLQGVLPKLHSQRDKEMAEAELRQLDAPVPPP